MKGFCLMLRSLYVFQQQIEGMLLYTVDDLEPKYQNQDSPHQNVKVGEQPRIPHPEPQDVFNSTLVSS
jgi:hypothetical protein